MQTAVQKIIEQIDEEVQVLSNLYGSEIKGRLIALAFAKKRCLEMLEMEKQQIIDAYNNGDLRSANLYYDETYGSKGSDETLKEYHIVDTNEMVYSQEEVYHILVEHTAFLFQGGKSTLTEWFEKYKK